MGVCMQFVKDLSMANHYYFNLTVMNFYSIYLAFIYILLQYVNV
jgi:hypothetical protein